MFFFFFLSCRFKGMQGTVRSGLITVLKTVRSDRGSHGSLHLSSRTVLDAKRTAKMSGSRFFRSDRTVRSGFHNHAHFFKTYLPKHGCLPHNKCWVAGLQTLTSPLEEVWLLRRHHLLIVISPCLQSTNSQALLTT